MSRKKTDIEDNNIPIPNEKTKTKKTGTGNRNIVQLNDSPIMINTIIKAMNEKRTFIIEDKILEIGNRYFGTYIFFMTPPFPTIDPIANVVDSLKKLNTI